MITLVDMRTAYDWGVSKITIKGLEQGGVRRPASEVVKSRGPEVVYCRRGQYNKTLVSIYTKLVTHFKPNPKLEVLTTLL